MQTITSKDGTTIAYEEAGQGPALIMVVGAFNDHTTAQPISEQLKRHFTVYNYDRRGRGQSTDTLPYTVEREVEDLDALITAVGGAAYVFGYSSGAVLALKAAAGSSRITKLAVYEAPLMLNLPATEAVTPTARISNVGGKAIEVSNTRQFDPKAIGAEVDQLVQAGKRGEAVEVFQIKGIGIPAELVAQMRNAPFHPALEKMAHTLVYEMNILADLASPADTAATLKIPTLWLAGAESPAFMGDTAKTLAAAAHGQAQILAGQTHDLNADVLSPILQTFFVG
jgi:pimeloyl-ACP methyl ester carboxylesterase